MYMYYIVTTGHYTPDEVAEAEGISVGEVDPRYMYEQSFKL